MQTQKPRLANLKLLFVGTLPPLLLLVAATLLDSWYASFGGNPLAHALVFYGSWACVLVIAAILAKAFYLPWLFRDRALRGRRVVWSLAFVLVVLVFASGYVEVAVVLVVVGIIVNIKEGGEAARFRRHREAETDESAWYYVGEKPEESESQTLPDSFDPYETLEIGRDASIEEIKAAYRRVIKECHPDMHGGLGDSARFRLASEAYERLIN